MPLSIKAGTQITRSESQKAKKKTTSASVSEPANTFFPSEVDLHYMFVWSLTFEKQAMKYERANAGALVARLF